MVFYVKFTKLMVLRQMLHIRQSIFHASLVKVWSDTLLGSSGEILSNFNGYEKFKLD